MKKVFGLFLLGSFFFANCFAANKTFESGVLKVNVYRSMPGNDFFRLEQLGSSIYLGSGKIITNAHVILDSNTNEPFDTIEICGSTKNGSDLKCGYTAKVISYDPDIDLALLSLDQGVILSGVKLADTDPSTGNPITIKGYPWDGFSTLTQTQGTVGGVYNDYYKIDASINGGNSGGGGFNAKFALIGIPTFKAASDANIGYIIPISAIKSFLKGNGNIIKHTNISNKQFSSHIQSINTNKRQSTIGGKLFSFTIPTGFKLDDINIAEGLFNYTIINTKANVSVNLANRQIRGKLDLAEGIQQVYDLYKNQVDKITTGTMIAKNVIWSGFTAETKGNLQSSYYTIIGNNLFTISIAGDSKSNDLKTASTWYKNILFRQLGQSKLPAIINWKNLAFASTPLITFSKKIDIQHDYDTAGYDLILDFDVVNAKKNSSPQEDYSVSASVEKIEDSALLDQTAEEILNIDTYNVESTSMRGLVKNALGSVFYIDKYKNRNGDYTIDVLGFNTIDGKKYTYTLSFNAGSDTNLASLLLDYLDKHFQVLGDTSFVERSTEPVLLPDLIAGKKTNSTKIIDTSKVSFYDYTNYTEKKLSWDERYRLSESNKQGTSYIKLIDLKTTYTPGTDYLIKWYGENLKSVSVYLLSEDGAIAEKYNIAVNKDSPSGIYYLSVPKNAHGPLLVNIDGVTQKDQSISDYSDTLITQQ